MKKPSVFLSSTFYDLKQIRTNLRGFIEDQLGYIALLSETSSFPVDPDADTVENCRKRVQDNADLLVLVIGGRYGSVPHRQSASVTNMEYVTARAKRIPIYAFVEKTVLSHLATWKDNPKATFTNVVDDVRVFEFVSEVRSHDGVWTYEFENAQDIIDVLRAQFAFLMNKGLELETRLRGDPAEYESISGPALRLAIERPPGWQGQLFAQLLIDEIGQYTDLKRAYQMNINFGAGHIVQGAEVFAWLTSKPDHAIRLASGITRLINEVLNKAFEASDIQDIAFAARVAGSCYRECLNWATSIREAFVDTEFESLRDELALMTSEIIEGLELLGPRLVKAVHAAVQSTQEGPISVKLEFVVTAANIERVNREFEKIKLRYGVTDANLPPDGPN